jgi:hypothetical protein
MTEEDIKKLQSTGGDHLAATEQNILGNDLGKVWEYISSKKFGTAEKGGRMDFVLDNAGFELYCDCVYADWLIQSGLCSEIRFHGKVWVFPLTLISHENATVLMFYRFFRSASHGSSRTSPARTLTGSSTLWSTASVRLLLYLYPLEFSARLTDLVRACSLPEQLGRGDRLAPRDGCSVEGVRQAGQVDLRGPRLLDLWLHLLGAQGGG